MKLVWMALAAAALSLPGPARAEVFRYLTDDGTVAFTDDAKRIPARYRAHATREQERSLGDYPRLTVVEHRPRAAATREEGGPAAPPEGAAPVSPGPGPEGSRLRVGPRTTLVDLPVDTQAPVRIERTTQWSWIDGEYRPQVVVKRDGRIVSTVRLR